MNEGDVPSPSHSFFHKSNLRSNLDLGKKMNQYFLFLINIIWEKMAVAGCGSSAIISDLESTIVSDSSVMCVVLQRIKDEFGYIRTEITTYSLEEVKKEKIDQDKSCVVYLASEIGLSKDDCLKFQKAEEYIWETEYDYRGEVVIWHADDLSAILTEPRLVVDKFRKTVLSFHKKRLIGVEKN